MKSKIILIGSIIFVVIATLFAVSGFLKNKAEPSPQGTPPPSNNSSENFVVTKPPKTSTIQIGTPSGSVTIKNPYLNSEKIEEGIVIFLSSENYEMGYNPADGSFQIFAGAPSAITEAERKFMEALGITQRDACKLTVIVTTPGNRVEKSLPLSFCGGRVQ